MSNKEIQLWITAFREARKAYSQMYEDEKITWDDFSEVMTGYELILSNMGVDI